MKPAAVLAAFASVPIAHVPWVAGVLVFLFVYGPSGLRDWVSFIREPLSEDAKKRKLGGGSPREP